LAIIQKLAIWHILRTIDDVYMRHRRRRRNQFYYRRRRRNWWPWIIFVVVAGLFFWAVLQFFMVLFSNVKSETISADLNIEQGRAEFLLPEKTDWSPAFSENTFYSGDSIKTARNSRVALRFLDNNQLFLDEDTELKIVELSQKSSGRTNAIFEIKKGQVWAQINDTIFSTDDKSELVLQTSRSQTYVQGTTFNISTNETQDTIALVKGLVSVSALNGDTTSERVDVGVGQSINITDETFALIAQGETPIKAIEAPLQESDWYLDNLERQFPAEAELIRARIAPPVVPSTLPSLDETTDSFTDLQEDSSIEAPTITTPAEGARINAAEDLVPIKGSAPLEAYQIQVNDYVLQRFEPGDRVWTYIASTEYGTLKPGDNTFNVIAITRDGKRSPIATLNVFYEGTASIIPAPAAPIVTPPSTDEAPIEAVSTTNIGAPIVTRPALFAADPDAVYETSASVVTFAGTVDPGVQKVEVNGFQLRKFEPGDREFSYIANANYGNMREGENIYTIRAFTSNTNFTESKINIFYKPVEID